MTEQDQIMLTHEPGTLDLASMTAVDLMRMGASARENEDRATAQLVTKELQKRYRAGTLNAEYNDPKAGRIIAEQRSQIEELTAKLEAAQAQINDLQSARLPEPNWHHAPPGSNWWAIDKNGDAYWYREQPKLSFENGEWMVRVPEYHAAVLDDSCEFSGWASSLRKRPAPMF